MTKKTKNCWPAERWDSFSENISPTADTHDLDALSILKQLPSGTWTGIVEAFESASYNDVPHIARIQFQTLTSWGPFLLDQRRATTPLSRDDIAAGQALRLSIWEELWRLGVPYDAQPFPVADFAPSIEQGVFDLGAAWRLLDLGWAERLAARRAAHKPTPYKRFETGPNFMAALDGDGPREAALCMALLERGVLSGINPLFSPADLMLAGRFHCAKALLEAGTPLGAITVIDFHDGYSPVYGQLGIGPIEARISRCGQLINRFGHNEQSPERLCLLHARQTQAALEDIERMRELGARASNSEAYRQIAGGDESRLILPRSAREAIGQWLASHGFDPNAGPEFGAHLCRIAAHPAWTDIQAPFAGSTGELFEWASRIGWNPAAHPIACFDAFSRIEAQLENHQADMPGISAMRAWLAERGVGAHLLAQGAPSPMAQVVGLGRIDIARRHFEQGAAWDFEEPFDGVERCGIARLLATQATKKPLALLRDALARPEVAARVDAPDGEGASPLCAACGALNLEAAKLLLAAGADPNFKDAKGWSPLRHALRKSGASAQKKAQPLIDILLAAGADPAALDAKGLTAAESAAARGPILAVAELLESSGGRLEDATGAAALQKLSARGATGRAVAERAQLGAIAKAASPSDTPDAARPKTSRRSL